MPQHSHSLKMWLLAIVAAVGNDVLDHFGGSLPIAGDILDIISTAAMYPIVGPFYDLFTLSELIPGVDFIPVHTSALLAAYLWRD